MKVKKRVKIYFLNFLLVVFFAGIVYSLYMIINWKIDTDNNRKLKEEVNKKVIVIDKDTIINPINDITDQVNNQPKYVIDWNSLKEQNPDTVAYLSVNNTNIDYVVVKGKDNSYYLNHNFNKESNIAGWPFTDYRNNIDGNDRNLIVFGHNTRDGSIFGSLKNILKKDWYTDEDNYIIDFVTVDGLYEYQVFSVYEIENEEYYIKTYFESDDEFSKFLNTIKNRSIYNFNIDLDINDKVLTLSTCTPGGEHRVVLHAKLINFIENKEE